MASLKCAGEHEVHLDCWTGSSVSGMQDRSLTGAFLYIPIFKIYTVIISTGQYIRFPSQ